MGMCKKCNGVFSALEMQNGLCKGCMSNEELKDFENNVKEEKENKTDNFSWFKYTRANFFLLSILPLFVFPLILISMDEFMNIPDYEFINITIITLAGFIFINFIWGIVMRGRDIGLHPFFSILIMILTAASTWYLSNGFSYDYSDISVVPFPLFLLFYLLMPGSKTRKEKKERNRLKVSKQHNLKKDIPKKTDTKTNSTRIVNFQYLLVLVLLGSFILPIIWEIKEYSHYQWFLDTEEFFRALLTSFIVSLLYGLYMMLIGLIKKLNTENKIWLVASLILLIFMTSKIIWDAMATNDFSKAFQIFYIFLALLIIPKIAFIIKDYWAKDDKLKATITGLVSMATIFALVYAIDTPLTQEQAIKWIKEDNTHQFKNLPLRFQENKEVAIVAVSESEYNLDCVKNSFKQDRDVVLAAVKHNGYALKYADKSFLKDREVVLAAVKSYSISYYFDQNESILTDLDKNLSDDKEIVFSAVKQHPNSLQFVNYSFKKNKELILIAVKENGLMLKFASYSLRNDKEVVLTAVKENGYALEYASDTLKSNKEVVLAAVKQDGYALRYANDTLKNDSDILKFSNK